MNKVFIALICLIAFSLLVVGNGNIGDFFMKKIQDISHVVISISEITTAESFGEFLVKTYEFFMKSFKAIFDFSS